MLVPSLYFKASSKRLWHRKVICFKLKLGALVPCQRNSERGNSQWPVPYLCRSCAHFLVFILTILPVLVESISQRQDRWAPEHWCWGWYHSSPVTILFETYPRYIIMNWTQFTISELISNMLVPILLFRILIIIILSCSHDSSASSSFEDSFCHGIPYRLGGLHSWS
jgi:hypothetical protein